MVERNHVEKKGVITYIRFFSEESGYAVAKVKGEEKEFDVVGIIPGIKIGKNYLFTGFWNTHKKYGLQFKVQGFTEIVPETTDEIELFLASGVISGVGPATAKLIIRQFGDKALDVIENEPKRLMDVEGIGEKKWVIINKSYVENREFAKVVLHFSSFDITPAVAKKLYDKYGLGAIAAINENPYQLIEDIPGIGFKSADKIASKLGLNENNEQRIKSAVIYCLQNNLNEGNTYVPETLLIESVIELIDVSTDETQDAIIDLAFDGKIIQTTINEQNALFLSYYHSAEMLICRELFRLQNAGLKMITSDVEGLINKAEKHFSDSQKNAIISSLDSGVFVITGGPGTGKTTIIKTIMKVLTDCGFEVAIAAPTGRAAKRITETTGYNASTIHRLLEFVVGLDDEHSFYGRNSENPLQIDAIIIDEASMVDDILMKALLQAIPSGARLIITGDADQLPSVGPGNVLRDILDSGTIPSAYLTEIFRQEGESNIIDGAHKINKGSYPELDDFNSDFFMLERMDESKILSSIIKLCTPKLYLPEGEYDFIRDVQVLTPQKKGILGRINLNEKLQLSINPASPDKKEMLLTERIFREGDRVMQIKNDYQKEWTDVENFVEGMGVFNGDLGVISAIDVGEQIVKVLFDGSRLAEYSSSDLIDLELAYAITVHKSQGSEFPVVVMPIFATPPMLATRNIIYTAVTRGIEKVILVGDKNRLYSFIDNDSHNDRWSGLSFFLKEKNEMK